MPKLLADELEDQIRQVIRKVLLERPTIEVIDDEVGTKRPSAFIYHAVILNETISAGTFLNPNSGMATICTIDSTNDELTQTSATIKVWNHTAKTQAIDTPGVAIPVHAGHFWLFGDCDPWDARPAPPGGP